MTNSLLKLARQLAFLILSMTLLPLANAQVCAAPGVQGTGNVPGLNTLLNTFYPGTASGGVAGGSVVGFASASARGAATVIAAGDLILIIQMQDGTAGTTTNNAGYAFPAAAAGRYEFARVVSVGANVLNLSANLINTYTQNTAVANNQTYQVVRVPQYSALTINAAESVVPAPWDGTSGGVVALDVSGAFVNNGSINASYAGFRGNAGATLGGVANAAASTLTVFDRVQPDTYAAHGGKGEGTAGSPDRVLNVFASPGVLITAGTSSANGTTTNLTTAATGISSTTAYFSAVTGRSYNGGSRAAGAPGNAGGGGTDGRPADNAENSGGGGGANSGAGGIGGNSWNSNESFGGRGGVVTSPALTNRLTLGGGGGSGSTNNDYRLDTSGGAGGGLIFVKAGTVAGSGSLVANGQAGRSVPAKGGDCPANGSGNCDGGGGGGAGGGIVVLASSGSVASAQVQGGQGGNINGTIHGPGGGGGGGYVVTSSGVATTNVLTGGAAGLTNVGAGGTPAAYGATPGAGGAAAIPSNAALPAAAGGLPANCLPVLTTTKITSTPAATSPIAPPGTTTYLIGVSNAAGKGDARGINLYDPTLPGGSVTVANPPLPTVIFSTAPSACALAARTSVVNPPNGATATFTMGTFNLPGGCSLTYSFVATVPNIVPNGTYSNSALSSFLDPTSSVANRTVTAALPPAAAGLTVNTSFTTGGTVTGSNYDGNLASNTGDDIRVQRSANLQITKTNGTDTLVAGSTTAYTVTVSNLGPSDASGALLRDPIVPGLSCTSVVCSGVTGAAACPTAANITLANLQSPPGSGIVLNTFPANSSISFIVTCGVTATGQ